MQLRLAAGYPSERAPEVSLSALWLSAAAAADLEAQLQQLWQEQGPGAPVCYSWADWLQSTALQHLGAAEVLVLAGGHPSSSSSVGGSSIDGSLQEGESGSDGRPSSSGSGGIRGGGGMADAQGRAEDTLMKLLRWVQNAKPLTRV